MKDFLDIEEDFRISHHIGMDFFMPRHHFHSHYEIYFNPVGGISYLVQDRIYEIQPNDMLIFNDRDVHHPAVPPNFLYNRYVITFCPSFIRDWCTPEMNLLGCFENRSSNFCHKLHLSEEQASSFQRLLQQEPVTGVFATLSQKILLAQILIQVNTLYQAQLSHRTVSLQEKNEGSEIILQSIAYINENLSKTLSLGELADMAYRNKYYFSKLFKKSTGFTPHEYISLRRVLRASELLREGMPVSAVCESVGYKSESHFITKFREYWGISPKQFALLKQTDNE